MKFRWRNNFQKQPPEGIKKVERLNEDGPYGKLFELEVDATEWRSSARAFARGRGSFGFWFERIRLGYE
jgi:hypothetical protein